MPWLARSGAAGTLCAAAVAAIASTVSATCSGPGCFGIYYKTAWPAAYLHYNAGPGWNGIPGVQLESSTNVSYPASEGWLQTFVGGNAVTWVCSMARRGMAWYAVTWHEARAHTLCLRPSEIGGSTAVCRRA